MFCSFFKPYVVFLLLVILRGNGLRNITVSGFVSCVVIVEAVVRDLGFQHLTFSVIHFVEVFL